MSSQSQTAAHRGGVGGVGGEPPTSRIPKPSPLPIRRSLSLRLRSTNNAGDQQTSPDDIPGKPYNIDAERVYEEDSTDDAGEPHHAVSCVPSAATASRPYGTLTNSKSLTHIAGCGVGSNHSSSSSQASETQFAAMAHSCNGRLPNGKPTKEAHPAHFKPQSNGIGSHRHNSSSHGHGMSIDLKSCAGSKSHSNHTPSSGNPSPLPLRRRSASAAGVNRAHSFNHTPHTAAGVVHGGQHKQRLSPKTPPVSPDDPLTGYQPPDDDLESVYSGTSMASGRSTMFCDHPFVARNGTTFSGRQMKYVVHCSSYAGQTGEDYLTPTQRAQKHIRRLKVLLSQAHIDLEQRDSEILRLTKEVVELRLFKASLASPDDRSNSSDAVTVREMGDPKTSTDVSPIVVDPHTGDLLDGRTTGALMSKSLSPRHYANANTALYVDKMCSSEMQSSFADSGHFDDITTTSSVHSRDSYVQTQPTQSMAPGAAGPRAMALSAGSTGSLLGAASGTDADYERADLIRFYELKIEDLIKNHSDENQEIRVTHNDRVEALLQRLAECNARYSDMVPDHEQAKERIRELERQLEELQHKLQEQENKQNKMYLHMFAKGQEAERIQHADKIMELASTGSATAARVSVPELMQQLQVTQNELENIKDTTYVQERGNAQVLLSAKEAISLWLLGARKTMYRRLIDAQQSHNKVDPEVTLQFLKSAVYYFLTDKENTRGHLNAIESILGFSDNERKRIEQARRDQK